MQAVGYIRVSTNEQANEGISLQNQKEKIRLYCQMNDLDLVEIIEDAGASGKNLKREGVQRLLTLADEGAIDAVIVYKLDRLSRRVIDTLQIIERLESQDIIFHSLQEKIDTHSAMGKFFLNITASFAQMERDMISERTSDALQSKIARKERTGSIPYGYQVSTNGIDLIEHPEEQRAITLITELRNKAYSYSAICRELAARNYPARGKQWYPQTVKNILKAA